MFLFPSIVFEDLNESKIEVAQKVVKVETAVVYVLLCRLRRLD